MSGWVPVMPALVWSVLFLGELETLRNIVIDLGIVGPRVQQEVQRLPVDLDIKIKETILGESKRDFFISSDREKIGQDRRG